ncbi:hypothetical protein [Rugosimonospora acidiphila]|uniref:hypothetical protein n=1 Tax=Rugosimonospora acidiphila TaxID=556531 RepID=UPI0031EEC2BC
MTVRSWLHCVASEVDAHASNGAASRHQIDLALTAIDGDGTPPEWPDFYDVGRLNGFAGYAALDALNTDWYGTGLTHVQSVRGALADSQHGHQLDGRIAALAATSRAVLPGS